MEPGKMMWYVVVFLGSLGVDLIPVIAPPAWMLMLFLYLKFDLALPGVLVVGVAGSALGRYLLSLYIPRFANKHMKRDKQEDLKFLGKKLGKKLWQSWLFVFLYTVTPLSSTALFTAAGMGKVPPIYTVPPFFGGKLLSDALMLSTGGYAAHNLEKLHSPKGIITLIIGCLAVGVFLVIDWRTLLQHKKFRFTLRIWK